MKINAEEYKKLVLSDATNIRLVSYFLAKIKESVECSDSLEKALVIELDVRELDLVRGDDFLYNMTRQIFTDINEKN